MPIELTITGPLSASISTRDLILSRLIVQGDSLLGSKHIDAHVRADVVIGMEVALIPRVEFPSSLEGDSPTRRRTPPRRCESCAPPPRSH